MGRYVYDANLVTQAIDKLNQAISSLADVNTEINSGLSTISSATGGQYISIDSQEVLKFQELAEDVIEEDITTIQEKVTIIEDYENAPGYVKLFSSIGMGLTKFVEGVASGFEDIGDGVVSVVGFVGGLFNSDFKNSAAEYVAKDHVGDAFASAYEDGILSGINKYSTFGHTSTAANIFKGVGTAAPYVALSMTGVGLATETAVAAVSGIGSGTEAGLQKALVNNPNMKAGDAFNSAFAEGVWQGTKNAALVYVMGKASQKIQANANQKIANNIDDMVTDLTNGAPRLTPKAGQSLDEATQFIDDLSNPNALTRSEKFFTKANTKMNSTRLGKVLDKTDDIITNSKAANAVKSAASKVKNSGVVTTVTDKASSVLSKSKLLTKAGNAVKGTATAIKSAAAAHPLATHAIAATVFTADQIDEQVVGAKYREAQAANPTVATVNPIPSPVTDYDATPSEVTDSTPSTGDGSTGGDTSGGGTGGYTGGYYTDSSSSDNSGTSSNTTVSVEKPADTSTNTNQNTETTTDTNTNTNANTNTENNNNATNTGNTIVPSTNSNSGGGYYNSGNSSSGGGYSSSGYTGETTAETVEPNIEESTGLEDNLSGSFSELIGGNEYTNIPTSSAPITATTTTSGQKNSVIPVIAGLGAAAVAGLGTKAYLDKKDNNASSESEVDAEEWEEDSLNVDYNEAMEQDSDYLSPSDEYAYTDDEEAGSYEAVNSSELASMQ